MPANAVREPATTPPRSTAAFGATDSPPSPSRTRAGAGLLDGAAAGPDDRVLIIGAPGADLLCDALRHGCRTALDVVAPPAHPEPADIVVAPRVAGAAEAAAIALCARRALGAGGSGGRLAMSLLGHGARALARSVKNGLRDHGFARIRLRARAEGDLLLVFLLPRAAPGPEPHGAGRPAGRTRRSRS